MFFVPLRLLGRPLSIMASSASTKSFFVTKKLPEKYFQSAASKYTLDMWQEPTDVPRDELLKRVAGKSGIICTLVDRIDKQLLDAAGPQLRVVSTLSVGYDHIDVEECHRRGVAIGNTPDVLTDAVAELTIALLLATIRRLFEANRALREGKWLPGWGHFFMCGSMVKDSTIGMIGAGRIGKSIMKRLNGFEPEKFLYSTRSRHEELEKNFNAKHVPLEELLKQSDIVIVCCSLNDSTRKMLSVDQFKIMKSNSVLINTSRGAVIDQNALYDALRSGQIGAAGLDVFEIEPIPADDPLVNLDNCVLTPHIGSAAQTTRERMIDLAVANLEAGIEGRPLVAGV